VAVKTQLKIANTQFNRSVALNKEGLKPLTDIEEKDSNYRKLRQNYHSRKQIFNEQIN
jgi:multidrug resistance efflux pump